MSKIITYTLESDGSIPAYVVDGGYFPSTSDLEPPRDMLLVGVADDSAPGDGFADVNAIESYLVSIGGQSWTDAKGSPLDLAEQAEIMWSRLSVT